MTKYVLTYQGGGMAATPAEQDKAMAEWGAWFGTIAADLLDGGNPFGASKTVNADGSVNDGAASSLSGFSVINATSLDAAAAIAKGCPVLHSGGAVEVYEAIDM